MYSFRESVAAFAAISTGCDLFFGYLRLTGLPVVETVATTAAVLSLAVAPLGLVWIVTHRDHVSQCEFAALDEPDRST